MLVQQVFGGGQRQATEVCTEQIQTRPAHNICWLPFRWFLVICDIRLNWTPSTSHDRAALLTCEFLDRLQPHADGLVGEQRRGGQRARHALHNANMLHTLGHGERGHSVVRFKGTITVYAATCRME